MSLLAYVSLLLTRLSCCSRDLFDGAKCSDRCGLSEELLMLCEEAGMGDSTGYGVTISRECVVRGNKLKREALSRPFGVSLRPSRLLTRLFLLRVEARLASFARAPPRRRARRRVRDQGTDGGTDGRTKRDTNRRTADEAWRTTKFSTSVVAILSSCIRAYDESQSSSVSACCLTATSSEQRLLTRCLELGQRSSSGECQCLWQWQPTASRADKGRRRPTG